MRRSTVSGELLRSVSSRHRFPATGLETVAADAGSSDAAKQPLPFVILQNDGAGAQVRRKRASGSGRPVGYTRGTPSGAQRTAAQWLCVQFGEASIVFGMPESCTLIANSETFFLVFEAEVYKSILLQSDKIWAMTKTLMERPPYCKWDRQVKGPSLNSRICIRGIGGLALTTPSPRPPHTLALTLSH